MSHGRHHGRIPRGFPTGRTRQQLDPRSGNSPGHRGAGDHGGARRPEGHRPARRRCEHLWRLPSGALRHVHAVSRNSKPARKAHLPHPGSCGDLPAHCWDLHPLLPRDTAGHLGLEPLWGGLGTCGGGRRPESHLRSPPAVALHPGLHCHGLDRPSRPGTPGQVSAHGRARNPIWRRCFLHRWRGLLRLEETPLPSRHLAPVRDSRQRLPRRFGALLRHSPL